MHRFPELLLDVWREACRHIDIQQSAATIARILALHMPIDRLIVLSFDWDRSRLLVSATGLHDAPRPTPAIRALTASEKKRLLAWAQSDEVLQHQVGAAAAGVVDILLPPHSDGDWLFGSLRNDQAPIGCLLLRAQPPQCFDTNHLHMLESLLEPFTVALENDHRLHELNALREAAEADKRSALSRLGRVELSDIIVGAKEGLRPVMDRVELVSRSDVAVLILGETGTGKEVIARAIHEHSGRSRGPFIRVNCGAIPPELIDSELFGHEKGAFTGATSLRRGWFERADEGTLLLDEVGELPLPAQVRLLRVVQEGAFERVGGEQPVHVDVRIIAATHRDLPLMVQQGRFREDLWYRIAGFPIVLPPLRERKGDIAALATHFAERAARRFGLRPQLPTTEDVEVLRQYAWPGNIRELASVIDRAAILGDGQQLEVVKALGGAGTAPAPAERPASAPASSADALASLNDAMRLHIEAALRLSRGQVEGQRGAARRLGVNPHTLRAKMRKLGVEWGRFREE